MGSRELLQKVVDTTQIGAGGGGILSAKQANKFLDYVFDQSVLMHTARVIRMNGPTMDIDKIDIGRRIMRKATEATDDGVNADPTFSKISLVTVKLRLDWELSTEGLEDNIEGASLEDHVASLMARQTANDLEDLYIHGDTASADPLLKSLDGFRKRARAGAHVVDAAGSTLNRSVFDQGLRALPNKYLQRRNQLVWTASSSLIQDYFWSLTIEDSGAGDGAAFNSALADAVMQNGNATGTAGAVGPRVFGMPLYEVPLYEETEAGSYSGASGNHGVVELTFPQNRIIGIQRDIVIYREFKPKKDAIEYTQFIRIANQIENLDAYVHIKNVKVRA